MGAKILCVLAAATIWNVVCLTNSQAADSIVTNIKASTVSKSRQTPFGLYVSPSEAHKALQKDPSIVLIDVRDPVEISFVGHPSDMDSNIPLRTVTTKFNPGAGRYDMQENKGFVTDVNALMKRLGLTKLDPIIVSCRSGPRSAVAARLLYSAGYKNVWNQIEGFEGSIDKKTGTRSKNGWRNAGLPWRYKIKAGTQWRPNVR